MVIKTTALAVTVGAVFLSSSILAQAPVVDRVVGDQVNAVGADQSAVRNNYLEIQALREEVSSLRGLIEELNYELRKIQRRQDEDYQNLDQRIAAGNGAPGAIAPESSAPGALPTLTDSADDVDALYREGFNALRNSDRDGAVKVFDELIKSYPGSTREPDALYWLGETHWLNLEIEKSRQSFTRLLEAYPDYRKSADAQYRLGLIYDQLGDKDKASEYMRALAESDSSQAEAAKTYLQENGAL